MHTFSSTARYRRAATQRAASGFERGIRKGFTINILDEHVNAITEGRGIDFYRADNKDLSFYESFANSGAFLASSYQAVTRSLLADLEQASEATPSAPADRVRAILAFYFHALAGDARSARLFLVEIGEVSAELDRIFADSLDSFGALIERTLGEVADPLVRKAVVGGAIHLASDWVTRGYLEPVDAVTRAAFRLCLMLGKAGDPAH